MRYSKEQDKSVELCGTIIVTFPAWGVGIFFILGFFTDPLFPIRLPVSIIMAAVISFYMYSTSYYKKWWDAFEKASPEEQMRMEEERFQEEERRKKEREERERKAAEEKRKREEEERKREEEERKRAEEREKEARREIIKQFNEAIEESKRRWKEEEREREEDHKKHEEWVKRQVMERSMRWF